MPLANIEDFIQKFSQVTEEYTFYNGEVVLRYAPKEHIYYLVTGDSLIPQTGVTSAVHIIDKSAPLIAWACKMMAQKLFNTVPVTITQKTQTKAVVLTYDNFEKLVLDAKNAHKEKLDEASSTGHIAHAWIENQIKKSIEAGHGLVDRVSLDPAPNDERAANCCTAATDWMWRHRVRWIYTERKIYSRKYQYAGTADGLCTMDSCDDQHCCHEPFKDRLSLADWKTSNGLYIEYVMQTAAYEQAIEEESGVEIIDRWVIQLGKETGEFNTWHLTQEDFEDDFNAFLLALQLGKVYDKVDERQTDRKKGIRAARKAEAKAVKEEALKLACANSGKYQGIRKPACNQGSPCESCLKKYAEVQAAKPPKKEKKTRTTVIVTDPGGVEKLARLVGVLK